MKCIASNTAPLSLPRSDQDQLTRLIGVYRSAGLDNRAAHQAARADLDSLQPSSPEPPKKGQPAPSIWLVLAAFAAIYFIWGSTFLAIRYAVVSVPPFLLAGARFGVAGLLLYGIARARGAKSPTQQDWKNAAIIGLCMVLIGNGGVTWAEQVIPSGVAALIVALIPLWMVIFDWLRPGGLRPRPLVFIGLAVGFAGVALLVGGSAESAAHGWGVLALVVASMSWAIGSLFSRRARKPASPLMSVAIQMIAGGGLTFGLGLATGEAERFSLQTITPLAAWSWVYLCLAGSLIGYTAYVWLLQVSTPARVSTYAYVNPLIAVLLGCTIGKEPFSEQLLLAAGLIVVAVSLIVRGGASRELRKPRPLLVSDE